jgi:hypothetical protein
MDRPQQPLPPELQARRAVIDTLYEAAMDVAQGQPWPDVERRLRAVLHVIASEQRKAPSSDGAG